MSDRPESRVSFLAPALLAGALLFGALELAQRPSPGADHAASHPSAPNPIAPISGPSADAASHAVPDSSVASATSLPSSRAYSPEESRSLMRLEPGFVAELVCAEPLIEAPVAIAFDSDARLWVVEMRGYMPDNDATGEREPSGRITILTDQDHDGFYETARVFMDKLVLPRGVLPLRVTKASTTALVLAPPNLFIAHDDNNDGVCDRTIPVMNDLGGIENPEHAPNGLLRGLDNWIEFSQHDKAFRVRADAIDTRPVPLHGQWGLSKDDLGRVFYVPNSDALRADFLPKHYFARNRQQSREGVIYELVQPDPTVWPIRPTVGVNRGYMKGILRPDGRLATHTAACAPVIYREHAFGPEFVGNAFVCEPAAYLVKRHTLEDQNGVLVAHHATPGREFLASLDERFRPVNSCVGPDGSLYFADMYRGVIQHKTYLTPYLKDYIKAHDLESPLNCGRIWRIRRATHEVAPRPAPVKLSELPTPGVASYLESPEGWWRDAAQSELTERADAQAADESRRVFEHSTIALARLHALWTLEGIAFNAKASAGGGVTADTPGLAEADIAHACADTDPNIRAAGLRLLVERAKPASPDAPATPDVLARFDSMSGDPSPVVRRQAVLSLPLLNLEKAALVERLSRIIQSDSGDRLMRVSVVNSAAGVEFELLSNLFASPAFGSSPASARVVGALAECLVKRNDATRRQVVALAADLSLHDDERCVPILKSIAAAQNLRDKQPRTIKLDAEPAHWRDALSRAGRYTPLLEASDAYLTWKGRVNEPIVRELTESERKLFDHGRSLYTICAGCHGIEGQGVAGSIPPLAGSARVLGRPETLAKIVLHGLEGPLDTGEPTNAAMPASPVKTDEDIASVLTFVRRSWGNAAPPVSPDLVRDVRKANQGRAFPWTRKELDEK
ncbi:MAG: PVC-type heme-binding CxxCH protein [Phycisphaerales bacterium]